MTTPPQAALLSDGEIIAIRKSAKPTDPAKAWGDTIALARGIEAAILAKLQATQEPVQSVPEAMKVVTEALRSDPDYAWSWHCNVAMASVDEGMGHYEANQAAARFMHLLAGVDTTKHQGFPEAPEQETVQAGELPALPHDGWPARFRCDSCDGNGEIGELISMGHFQPPERQTCPDCGGRGWSDEGPAFNADHMRDYARAVLSARKPLTEEQRAEVFRAAESRMVHTINLSWRNAVVDEVERAHGIGLEVKP